MKLRIRGAYNTISGYSDLVRYVITALHQKEYNFDIVPCTWTAETVVIPDFEEIKKIHEHDNSPYGIEITITPPDSYEYFYHTTNLKDSKYRIVYTMWEADQIHPGWVNILNKLAHEVWVPCNHNVEAFKNSGVTIPITKMPFPIPKKDIIKCDNIIPEIYNDYYKFYSIFQWTPRKNPLGLLQAYYTEFKPEDKVILVLRTYLGSHVSSEIHTIIKYIKDIQSKMNLPYYPPICYIHDYLDENELYNLHNECDCYVTPHKGEGWSLPTSDAMQFGKLVIVSNYSGTADFCNDSNSILLNDLITEPVYDMKHCNPKYNSYMTWKCPTIDDIRINMRYAYDLIKSEYYDNEPNYGLNARNTILNNYNFDIIGNRLIDRLEDIYDKENKN
jgi:glycosyltransferase involved in cell wall biosynthesis